MRDIILELDGRAREVLGQRGYDPVYGARPLKRIIQKYVQDPIALKILTGEIKEHSRVRVTCPAGQEIVIKLEKQ